MEVGRQSWVEYHICCVALAEVAFPKSVVRRQGLSTSPLLAVGRHPVNAERLSSALVYRTHVIVSSVSFY